MQFIKILYLIFLLIYYFKILFFMCLFAFYLITINIINFYFLIKLIKFIFIIY